MAAKIKVLCTADLHLGRTSACIQAPTGVDVSAVGAWQRIVQRAIAESADVVAIAGDVFDGLPSYYETRRAFAAGLDALAHHGITTVATAGNHDYQALRRFGDQYSDPKFHLIGFSGWEHIEITTPNGDLKVCGWSFPSVNYRSRAFDGFRAPETNLPVLGLVHGDLTPATEYHPIHPKDLETNADAWIVGHIHLPRVIGAKAIYPGSPQALDFGPGERGPHGFFWLEIGPGSAQFSALEPCSTVLFCTDALKVRVSEGMDPYNAGVEASQRRLSEIRTQHPGVESAQTRFSVTFYGLESPPDFNLHEETTLADDAYLWTDCCLGYDQDPWQDASVNDLFGEAARLLLGAQSKDGFYLDRAVDPDWTARAAREIEKIAAEVKQTFHATIGKATDSGDGARICPSDEEAASTAREAFVNYLEQLLRNRSGSLA